MYHGSRAPKPRVAIGGRAPEGQGVWTSDGGRALRVARAIDAGVLSLNTNTSVRVATPSGGFRIDVLFNNAGISPTDDASVPDTSLEATRAT